MIWVNFSSNISPAFDMKTVLFYKDTSYIKDESVEGRLENSFLELQLFFFWMKWFTILDIILNGL